MPGGTGGGPVEEEEILDEEEDEGLNFVAIIGAVVLLLLIGFGAWYFFFSGGEEEEGTKIERPVWVPPENLAEEQVYDALPELIINPADSEGRYFLIVKIDVVYNNRQAIYEKMIGEPWRFPQIQNLIIDIFSSYTRKELQTPKFKEMIRQQITDELNALLGWEGPAAETGGEESLPPIEKIYFSQYILQ